MAELLHYALLAGESLYRPNLPFKKAGVILLELTPISQQQLAQWDTRARLDLQSLVGEACPQDIDHRWQHLMQTLDLNNAC
jgi:hypothetical protein